MREEDKKIKKEIEAIREKLGDRIVSVYAFGSRVRKIHGEWSDLDLMQRKTLKKGVQDIHQQELL